MIRELFGLLLLFGVLWFAVKTDIPEKSIAAIEAQLDSAATQGKDK